MRMTTSGWPRPIRWPRSLAGATHINTTVNGLGERAGNAPLEEAVMALRHLYSIETGIDPRHLPALSALVARASGRNVASNKSIVGEAVFTHESGIHVDGIIKNPLNYQGFDPLEIGREHRLVLGKHSGSRAVLAAYANLGIRLSEAQAQAMLLRIRDHAVGNKRSPSGDDLALLPGGGDVPRRAFLSSLDRTRHRQYLMTDTLQALSTLSAAEEFFAFFSIPFEPAVVHVNRLHILKRFNQYLRLTTPDVAYLDPEAQLPGLPRPPDSRLRGLHSLDAGSGEGIQSLSRGRRQPRGSRQSAQHLAFAQRDLARGLRHAHRRLYQAGPG